MGRNTAACLYTWLQVTFFPSSFCFQSYHHPEESQSCESYLLLGGADSGSVSADGGLCPALS